MKIRSCPGIENGGSATHLKEVFLSITIATSSLKPGKKKWTVRSSLNFTDLIFIIPAFVWLKTVEILNELKIKQKYAYNHNCKIFLSEEFICYLRMSTMIIIAIYSLFFRFVFILYNRSDLSGKGNRKRSLR